MRRLAIGMVAALAVSGGAEAQDVSLAEQGLQARIDALDARTDGFEKGMLMSLRAVERSMQTRYRYGLGDSLTAMPLLRMQLGVADSAREGETAGPEVLGDLMRDALRDLAQARAVLGQGAQITPFEMTLQDIWFDVNANGARDLGEDATAALGVLMGRRARQAAELAEPLTVRFDAADHAWLMAYTHMLSGFANLFVAFDPAPVLEKLAQQQAILADAPEIENTFDTPELRAELEALVAEAAEIQLKVDTLRVRIADTNKEIAALRKATPRDDAAIAALNQANQDMRRNVLRPQQQALRAVRAQISAIRAKLPEAALSPQERAMTDNMDGTRGAIDAAFTVLAALDQQPDAQRIKDAHAHWTQMIAQNKVFWARVAQETDNDREWVPSPEQTSALGIEVDGELAQAWQNILAEAEAVLEGRLLIPHPLLPQGHGISLKAYVEDPAAIDLLSWVQGSGVYKYAAKGPKITLGSWRAFSRLARGNAGGFALFFN